MMYRMDRTLRPVLVLVTGVLGVAAFAARAGAQQSEQQQPAPAASSSGPRIGHAGQAAPPQYEPARTAAPVIVVPQVIYYYPAPAPYAGSGDISSGTYGSVNAPFEILYDGSMLLNYGRGYERLVRACEVVQLAPARDAYGRDVYGNIPDPPGIAALKAGTRGTMTGAVPARDAVICYRTYGYGRVELTTPR
jgi:hypothetical protein